MSDIYIYIYKQNDFELFTIKWQLLAGSQSLDHTGSSALLRALRR